MPNASGRPCSRWSAARPHRFSARGMRCASSGYLWKTQPSSFHMLCYAEGYNSLSQVLYSMPGCGAMGKGASMQFGLFYGIPDDPRCTHAERFAEILDLIV